MTLAWTLVELFCKIFAHYTLRVCAQQVAGCVVVECDVVHDGVKLEKNPPVIFFI